MKNIITIIIIWNWNLPPVYGLDQFTILKNSNSNHNLPPVHNFPLGFLVSMYLLLWFGCLDYAITLH